MKATTALARHLEALLNAVTVYADGSLLAVIERERLTPAALKALMLLDSTTEPLSVTGLADGLGLSLPTASRAAHALASGELISCNVADEDRRGRRLVLTARGRELLDELHAARLGELARFAESLPDAQCSALVAAFSTLNLPGR